MHLDLAAMNLGSHIVQIIETIKEAATLVSVHLHDNNISSELKNKIADLLAIENRHSIDAVGCEHIVQQHQD